MNFSRAGKRILEQMNDGFYFTDKERCITFWNKAAERITGYKASEVIGSSCADGILIHVAEDGTHLCHGHCPLADAIKDGQSREAEVYLHHKDGHRVPVSVRVSAVKDEGGTIIGGAELFTDISNRKNNELRVKELEKLALLDTLTQLANRNHIETDLGIRLEEMRRYSVPFGLLFMDIDYFKKFNDNFGHDVGDDVLKLVASTLVNASRPFDLYGRWGGEEFIGIIRNITSENLGPMAERLRMLIERSALKHNGEELRVTISIGATMVTENDTVETVVKRADTLLYESKHQGRNRVTLG